MAVTIFGALMPVFGLILIGYICGRYDILGDRAFEVLNRFVIVITLPILTFRSIAHMDPRNLAVACARCNQQKGRRHDARGPRDPRAREVVGHLLARRLERYLDPVPWSSEERR